MKRLIFNWIIVLSMIVTMAPPMFAHQDKSSEKQEYEDAQDIDDPVKRLSALKAFMAKYPKSKEIPEGRLLILSALLESSASADEIIAACEQAVKLMPKDFKDADEYIPMAYLRVAEALNNRDERLEKGLEFARKALSLMPTDSDEGIDSAMGAQLLVGVLLYKTGKADQAIPELQKVLDDQPNTSTRMVTNLFLSKAYEKKGDTELAIKAYIQSIIAFGKKTDEADEPLRKLFKQSEESLRSSYMQTHGTSSGFDAMIEKGRQESFQNRALKDKRYDRIAPEWELNDLTGKTLKSADFKGKVTVLNFWGSWCPYCENDLLQFQKLYERYKDKGIAFIAINVEAPEPEKERLQKAKEFIAAHSFSFPVAIDIDHVTAANYGLMNFPTIFLIDRGGAIRYKNVGASDDLAKVVEMQIEALTAAKADDLPAVSPDDYAEEGQRLFKLAIKMKKNGMIKGAIKVAEQVLVLDEMFPGKPDAPILVALGFIANACMDQKNYKKAQPYYQRVIQILERNPDMGKEVLPDVLYLLGKAYLYNNDFTKVEAPFLRALSLFDKQKGEKSENYKALLHLLANFYNGMRSFAKAEEMLQRMSDLIRSETPVDQMELANSFINIADVSHSLSNDAKAIQFLQSAQATLEKEYGKNSPVTLPLMVTIWSLLAHIYTESPQSGAAEYAKAEQYYQNIESLYKKMLPANDTGFGELYMNYALLHFAKDDLDKAESFLNRAVPILEKGYDHGEPKYALLLNNIATFDNARGRYAAARAKYVQAKQILEKAYGPDHYYVGMSLNNIAMVYEAEGNIKEAVKCRELANNIYEQITARTMGAGSEEQKSIYMGEALYNTDYTVSLHAKSAPDNLEAARAALTAALRSKGRILDVMTDTVGIVRRRLIEQNKPDEQDRALLEEWSEKRSKLASLVFQPPEGIDLSTYKEDVDKLDAQVQQLEAKLSARGAEILTKSQPVTIEAVQKMIPQDAVLVEYVLYHPFDLKSRRFGPPRYVAYILSHDGDPKWVILNDASTIDAAIANLREGLTSPKRAVSEVMQLARSVDELVMRPVRERIGRKDVRLLLSPDGQLNVIPFGALVDENQRYLTEVYSITYFSSGRDLLRPRVSNQNKRGPVIVANPDFNLVSPGSLALADVARKEFLPLTTTKEEVGKLIPGAEILFGADANKTAVKQLHGPRILHILTHGEFVDNSKAGGQATRGLAWSGVRSDDMFAHSREKLLSNPMLNSYLALAGAKHSEDGILRALEMASFDLSGTKLVVLSACETGLGGIQNGEGVYGLRRALVISGSESQILSLWKVAEDETQKFFQDYYDRLLNKGSSRGEALREVQKMMIQNPNLRHPYYWAAFIQSGAWEELEARR